MGGGRVSKLAPTTLANLNAEAALLSAACRGGPQAVADLPDHVREEWFTSEDRRIAWRVLSDMLARGLSVDFTLLADGMRSQGAPDVSIRNIIDLLASTAPTGKLLPEYARAVHGYFIRRIAVEICEAACREFRNLQSDPMEVLSALEASLFSLHAEKAGEGMQHISQSMKKAFASIIESIKNKGHVTGGLATGFTDLDRINIKGLRAGQMFVIGAPPGGGKTVMLMNLLTNIAFGEGHYHEFWNSPDRHPPVPVGVFSLEMSDEQLAERLLITRAKVVINELQRGMMSAGKQDDISAAVARINEAPFYIDYCPGATIEELRVKARFAVARFGLKAIGIDYAQLISSSDRAVKGNRTAEMVLVSKGINAIAKECEVPVIVLAQTKQEFWTRRAGLEAFAETSQLAKDAALAAIINHWDTVVKAKDEAEEKERKELADERESVAALDIVKNRNGPDTRNGQPIKLDWSRQFYNLKSTCSRLFDPQGNELQRAS